MGAFSVPKKNFKKAVSRNLLKRRMREAWRLNNASLKSVLQEKKRSLVVSVRYKAKKIVDYGEINKEMVEFLQFLAGKV